MLSPGIGPNIGISIRVEEEQRISLDNEAGINKGKPTAYIHIEEPVYRDVFWGLVRDEPGTFCIFFLTAL